MTTMYTRSLNTSNHSFFLLGPRGTGKSTWLKKHYSHAKVINLLDEGLYQDYLSNISLFYEELKTLPENSWVVVDEIQRLPNLLNEVHRLIEENKLSFALTGSSARKLRRSGVNLLAGRADKLSMYPLTPKELGSDFNLDEVLRFGSIPLVLARKDNKQESLNSYVQMYLKEEIKAEALVRNLSGFVRCLPVLALYNGQVLNVSSTARDAGVSRTTVNGFVEILEDTLLINKLPAFEAGLRVRERKHPKLYWIDPGLVRAAKKIKGEVSDLEKGGLFESYIYMCLKAKVDYETEFDEISYWSPSSTKNLEVDFLLQNQNEIVAIEVKTSKRIRPEDLRGLKAINELDKVKRRVLVYLGDKRLEKEGIEIFPFEDFCKEFLTV